MALEPVAETTADRISFGFRKYRSPEDVREYAFSVPSRKDSAQWIADNIPTDKRNLKDFLKCGYVEKRRIFHKEEGSPQGIPLTRQV